MKVELRFNQIGWYGEGLNVTIEGSPERVDAVVKATREAAKEWTTWEEK